MVNLQNGAYNEDSFELLIWQLLFMGHSLHLCNLILMTKGSTTILFVLVFELHNYAHKYWGKKM
jgi:hypothetical protein